MYIKRYTIVAIIFIAIIGTYGYLINSSYYMANIFGLELNLPVGLWIVIPAILLLIATISHFGFYSMINYFKNSRVKKDIGKIDEIIKNALLGNKIEIKIKDENINRLVNIINHSTIDNLKDLSLSKDELNQLKDKIVDIFDGKYIDLSKYKINKDSKVYIQNELNRVAKSYDYAEKILNGCKENSKICNKALEVFANKCDKKKFSKINIKPTKQALITFFKRTDLKLDNSEIIDYCKKVALDEKDYIQIAKVLLKVIEPDRVIELFYLLQKDIENASYAYIYINLVYEKLESVKEYLEQFSDDDFCDVRYYLKLKSDEITKIDLDKFLRIE
jgi:hypothetical protein